MISSALQPPRYSRLAGIGFGAGAGALWGLVFLAPQLVPEFDALQLTIGRYLVYGLISAALILPRWRQVFAVITGRDWLVLSGLALVGNTLYYILLSSAVQTGGIAMTSLIIGFLPVAVTIIGSRDHAAVPLVRLAPSLILGVAGAVCIGGQAYLSASVKPAQMQIVGGLCAIGALASWTWFAVGNSRCLNRLHGVTADDWNLLVGLVTGVQSLLLIPISLLLSHAEHSAASWLRLVGVSSGIAIVASIGGNALWNRMSRALPLTLTGQMILFETLFALIYGFVWEQRWPTLLEAAAFGLVVLSVCLCIAAHRTPKTTAI